MAGIEGLVRALREGDDAAKTAAVRALRYPASWSDKGAIAAAGGVPLLVELLRDGSADAKKSAVAALGNLTYSNAANKVLIACAGGIAPLVDFLRHSSSPPEAKTQAAQTLFNLANNNDANAVAIALAVGPEALVELARRGRVTVDELSVVRRAIPPWQREAARAAAALDDVLGRVPDVVRAIIESYLWRS